MEENVQKFKDIADSLYKLYEKKNTAYGDSFAISIKKYGLISALTRISDKFNRLESIVLHQDIDRNDERLEDTLMDLASYAIMTLVALEKKE